MNSLRHQTSRRFFHALVLATGFVPLALSSISTAQPICRDLFVARPAAKTYKSVQEIQVKDLDTSDAMTLTPDGHYVLLPVEGSSNSYLAVFDLRKSQITSKVRLRTDGAGEALFSSDGKWLLALDGGAERWTLLERKNNHDGFQTKIVTDYWQDKLFVPSQPRFTADSRAIVSIEVLGSEEKPKLASVRLVRGKSGQDSWKNAEPMPLDFSALPQSQKVEKLATGSPPDAVAVNPNSGVIYYSAQAGRDQATFAVDIETAKVKFMIPGTNVRVSTDGKFLVTSEGSRNHKDEAVFDAESGKRLDQKFLQNNAAKVPTDLTVAVVAARVQPTQSRMSADGRFRAELINRRNLLVSEINPRNNRARVISDLSEKIDPFTVRAFGFAPNGELVIRNDDSVFVVK